MRFYQAVLDTLTAKGYTAEQKQEIKNKLIAASNYQSTITNPEPGDDIPNPISEAVHIDKYLRFVILSKIKDGAEIIRRKAVVESPLDLTE